MAYFIFAGSGDPFSPCRKNTHKLVLKTYIWFRKDCSTFTSPNRWHFRRRGGNFPSISDTVSLSFIELLLWLSDLLSCCHTHTKINVRKALIYKQNGYLYSAALTDLPILTIFTFKSAPFSFPLYFTHHFPHAFSYVSVHKMIILYSTFLHSLWKYFSLLRLNICSKSEI